MCISGPKAPRIEPAKPFIAPPPPEPAPVAAKVRPVVKRKHGAAGSAKRRGSSSLRIPLIKGGGSGAKLPT